MNFIKSSLTLFFALAILFTSHAQDTLTVNVAQADSIFLANNFALLAANMNIEAQEAAILQEGLYPNPIFTADINAYDPENKEILHVGQSGQKVFQLEQLIIIGGKRKSAIDIAKTNASIAKLEFQQLILNLKFQLHSNLYTNGQQKFLLQKYNVQLTLLDSLLSAYQTQVNKGNIPMKELVRLKGAYLKLNNDRAELYRAYYLTQSQLQQILQTTSYVKFKFDETEIKNYVKIISKNELVEVALSNRPDYLIMKQNNIQAQQYITYQKRVAVPDVNLFTSYDQRGGAFNNQINAGISVPLPVWNRNQGNIKAAKNRLEEVQYNTQSKEIEVRTDIYNAHSSYMQTALEYDKATKIYNQDFEVTFKGMTENFRKRNVSIVEFIDFFEAYNEVLTEITRIKSHLVSTAEELNRLTGKDIY